MLKTLGDFPFETFEFEGKRAIVVFPHTKNIRKSIILKTEYWGAFPDIEIKLLERGFHVAYVENESRFAAVSDCDRKARFVEFLAEKYCLDKKCVPVGMSCGGAHAVRFAGFYPQLVSCVYIDAPVLNYCSFPGKIGNEECEYIWENEFLKVYPDIKRYQLVNFSEHPLCSIDSLIRNKVPVLMVYGTEDSSVIYEENGRLLELAYEGEQNPLLTCIRVEHRAHHPHGMTDDNTPIVDYIDKRCN